jgi:hypothetical protein
LEVFMNDKRIETYLRKSTRGLWGKRREEVREELSAHIYGRVNAHLIGGLSESDAVEKTLTELGHPTNVSAGMARLYTLPVVAGSGMMLAMCCAVVVVLLSGSTAQTLQLSNTFPTDECLNPTEAVTPYYCQSGGWIDIDSLKKTLEPQGVTFKSTRENWVLTFPQGSPMMLLTGSQKWFIYPDESDKFIELNINSNYIRLRDFISSLRSTKLPVSLEGWGKPVITVGDVSLEIDLVTFTPKTIYDDPPYTSQQFYQEALEWDLMNTMPSTSMSYGILGNTQSTATEAKRFKVDGKEGDVYGLVVIMDASKVINLPEDFEETSTAVFSDIARVDANGIVMLRSPLQQPLIFLTSPTGMYKVGQAVLVRLSGDFTDASSSYVTIPPDQIKLE